MPTYVYRFVDTGETIEVQQSFHEPTLTEATHPDGDVRPVKKVFTPVGVTFRGNGFYKTDSRGSKSTTDTSASKDSSSTGSSSSGSSSESTGSSSSSGSSDSSSSSGAGSSTTSSSSGKDSAGSSSAGSGGHSH